MSSENRPLAPVPTLSLAHTLPLQDRRHHWQLIEASAGTGKTWTMTGLYLRLLAERRLSVEQILVMTFTRAATAELRQRLQHGLGDFILALTGHATHEYFCQTWMQQHNVAPQSEAAYELAQHLACALRDFDRAQIFTLHGFCQRALEASAFSSGLPFQRELLSSASDIVHQLSADLWRRELVTHTDLAFVEAVQQRFSSPAALARTLQTWLGRNVTHMQGGENQGGETNSKQLSEQHVHYTQAWSRLRDSIMQHHAEVPAYVAAAKAAGTLTSASYRRDHLARWVEHIRALALNETPPAVPLTKKDREVLGRFSSQGLAEHAGLLGQAVDAFLSSLLSFQEARQQAVDAFTRHALVTLRTELRQRLAERGEQTFDGLLQDLHRALHSAQGEVLAQSLRTRTPVALIDECQDTDPLQFEILQRIYRHEEHKTSADTSTPCTVVMVGDPKQAIYQFRSADVFAYLSARDQLPKTARHTLTENQRSVPGLITAWNALIGHAPLPFHHPDLVYVPATPSPRDKKSWPTHDQRAPCVVLHLESEKALGKAEAKNLAAHAVANEIAALLNEPTNAQIQPEDIAILVNTNEQGELMRSVLGQHGVRAALRSRRSVYASAEASLLALVLYAVLYPQERPQVRAALLSDWWRFTPHDLEDERQLSAVQTQWRKWAHSWRKQGILPMVHAMLQASRMTDERRLVNLRHLAELLAEEKLASPEATLHYLCTAMEEKNDSENAQLRLESDVGLVNIVTVHVSKGLEWPVVFLPFLWDAPETKTTSNERPVLWHRRYEAVLDFSPDEAAQTQAQQELFEERLRSSYVALTRASHRCFIVWGHIKNTEASALGYWLGQEGLQGWIDRAPQAVERCEPHKINQYYLHAPAVAPDVASDVVNSPEITLPPAWRVSSFSSLAASIEPEPQTLSDKPSNNVTRAGATLTTELATRFSFARGTRAGILLHSWLEKIDWSAPKEQWPATLPREWLDEVRHTPLPTLTTHTTPFSLQAVNDHNALREVEFMLPLRSTRWSRLSTLAADYGYVIPSFDNVAFNNIASEGFLKGYIDLVCWQQGRAYLIDYKSNWLGDRIEDYHPHALEQAMVQHAYHAQHLLYLTALHLWLERHMPNYDYEQHVGGVYYLFLRGMSPEHPGQGIVATRPPLELVLGVTQLMAGL